MRTPTQKTADFTAYRPRKEHAAKTSEQLADEVAAFLEAGGEIERVKTGVSGIDGPNRHIVFSKKQMTRY